MILSLNFLRDYLELEKDIDVKNVAEAMTKVGNEYDSASKLINATKLVIGQVDECENHPDSDHLHVCKVNVGNAEDLQIVCGAPNVRKGLKVIVALEGAKLPGGEIKRSTIRGVESRGMLCSIAELGLDNKFLNEEDKKGICELSEEAKIGEDPIKFLGWDDNIIDFELTANRGDLLSIIGMAYELGAIYDKKVKPINFSHKNYLEVSNSNIAENDETIHKNPSNKDEINTTTLAENEESNYEKIFKESNITESDIELEEKVTDIIIKEQSKNKLDFNIKINTENCKLFLARKVDNIKIQESPKDIQEKLMASGIRPINNVVDISNYVMLETGQPLHFYDADKLNKMLEVRMANNGEKLVTLDKQERTLTDEDIVISDGEKAIGLAGVMGGLTTEITENTKNIIIESAIFDNVHVRRTSNKVLRSEASNRFEKGLDPNRTYIAMERASHLLEKYADGKAISGVAQYDKTEKSPKKIEITTKKINDILGTSIDEKDVLNVFRKLGFEYQKNGEKICVIVPRRRLDIDIKEDLIEEVGRIYGVDNIEGKTMILPVKKGTFDKKIREIRNKMVCLGLNETLSYSLVNSEEAKMFTLNNKESIKVLEPLTDEKSTLRQTLITSLYKIYKYNKARNNNDISIFEIGKTFYKEILNPEMKTKTSELEAENNTSNKFSYKEEDKLSCLMSGKYTTGLYAKNVDFYVIKGVAETILNYLGYEGRYSFIVNNQIPNDLHPGKSAVISVNNDNVGIIGRLNPTICKDDVYVMEINLDKLLAKKVGKMKYKELSKFPTVKKDLAFIVDKDITASEMEKTIKANGGKLLQKIEIFDLYIGKGIPEGKKSIAFSIELEDKTKTLTDEEIIASMNKITEGIEKKFGAELRKYATS